ncbi:hypothetical protein DFH29DRAFT_1075870 [Suillus ampliporus]|nr:hypothetical protein DFH29DRAFT_1075870 [Suillus ampliporus]
MAIHSHCKNTARAMTLGCVDLFCKMEKLLKVGLLLQQDQAAENGEFEEDEADRESRGKRLANLSINTRDCYKRHYQWLLQLAPGLRFLINDRTKSQELTRIAQVISGTRSDDATRLKPQIGHYAAPNPSVAGLTSPIC